jgi:hypothetical protein
MKRAAVETQGEKLMTMCVQKPRPVKTITCSRRPISNMSKKVSGFRNSSSENLATVFMKTFELHKLQHLKNQNSNVLHGFLKPIKTYSADITL